jgi:hypothetical protein
MGNPIFKSTSRLVQVASAEQVLATELESVVGTATILVKGVRMTAAQLVALFSGHVAEITALAKSKAELHDQVLKQKASRVSSHDAALAIKAWVVGNYGASSPQTTTLGFQPPNRHPATVATKVEAQVKSKATRTQRRTTGKRKQGKRKQGKPAKPR